MLGWWGRWSGDVAPAEQCGADEQDSGTPPTLGITRPVRHRPSDHKPSRPHMPQGVSAGPQPAYRPGPAGGPRTGDWPGASARTSARPRRRPAQRGHLSQPGTAPLELQQHGEQLVAAEPGPPRSQRHHERAGRLQQDSSATPRNRPFCTSRRTPQACPSGMPYSIGDLRAGIKKSRFVIGLGLGWRAQCRLSVRWSRPAGLARLREQPGALCARREMVDRRPLS